MLIPLQIDLALRPRTRCDVIDVTERVREAHGDALAPYRRALYCSLRVCSGSFPTGALNP